LHATLKEMRISNCKTLMVGDSKNDVLAAKAAGIPVALANFGYAKIPAWCLGADLVLTGFRDLLLNAKDFL
jgi:phosphoglycolate phosphatase